MSLPIQLAVAVGGLGLISLGDAEAVAAVAEAAGVAAIRLADRSAHGPVLDPTVVAAYLAGRHGAIGYVPVLPTTGNAPYNAARRLLSLDRATGGRTGVALRPGHGDEVSERNVPDPGATDPVRRWTEYARVLARLWDSFPRAALIGDQRSGVVADDTLIDPIHHEGTFYRVAGPLDGPSSAQGRPVVVADLDVVDVTAAATVADVVVADLDRAGGADTALTRALGLAGRDRREVALLGRVRVTRADATAELAARLRDAADEHLLDGIELLPEGGAADIVAVLRALPPRPLAPTLRSALGLRGQLVTPA
ncbi:LLM class flavin-dependent oxidoreductase [Actinoplanes regularis]|uniref:LLM class flavin-dependent oxidoreductase n=1 Tax=Actinoplanes regularis TaxID=52697 RepID=UPI0024A01FA6|nr:LLM class flavin-dependent oxidoreductase [Actinoplanes regularis]GLW30304.1 monooxygenase [Actinoplanes regularis]